MVRRVYNCGVYSAAMQGSIAARRDLNSIGPVFPKLDLETRCRHTVHKLVRQVTKALRQQHSLVSSRRVRISALRLAKMQRMA